MGDLRGILLIPTLNMHSGQQFQVLTCYFSNFSHFSNLSWTIINKTNFELRWNNFASKQKMNMRLFWTLFHTYHKKKANTSKSLYK